MMSSTPSTPLQVIAVIGPEQITGSSRVRAHDDDERRSTSDDDDDDDDDDDCGPDSYADSYADTYADPSAHGGSAQSALGGGALRPSCPKQ
eukprot:9479106-Pyramimonas_sp.AAC.1